MYIDYKFFVSLTEVVMNVNMFPELKKTVLTPERKEALVVWSLVSAIGRAGLSVGEVAKFVTFCSGRHVSNYQVKKLLVKFERDGLANEIVKSYDSGRQRVTYTARPMLLISLTVMCKHLPVPLQKTAWERCDDINNAAWKRYEELWNDA